MPKTTTTKAKAPVKNLAPQGEELELGEDIKPAARPGKTTSSLDDLFPKMDHADENINLLLWGREGSAKTTMACSAANFGPTLVINAEGGLKMKALQRQGVNTDNIRVWPNPKDPVDITHESLEQLYWDLKAILANDPSAIYAVVMDSASEITETMVSNVSNNRLGKTRKRGVAVDDYDAFETDRNDYGVMAKHFRDIARKMRDLPCHFILTALERRDVDEDTGSTMYGPAVSPSLQKDLLGYVDLVIYMKAADEDVPVFRGLTKQQGKFRAKDRMGGLPRVLAEPSFERILGYDNEELVESDDPIQQKLLQALTVPEKKPQGVRAKRAAAAKVKADAETKTDEPETPAADADTEEEQGA